MRGGSNSIAPQLCFSEMTLTRVQIDGFKSSL